MKKLLVVFFTFMFGFMSVAPTVAAAASYEANSPSIQIDVGQTLDQSSEPTMTVEPFFWGFIGRIITSAIGSFLGRLAYDNRGEIWEIINGMIGWFGS